MPRAKHTARVDARRAGYVTAIHCEQVGVASMLLGGGREKKEDSIDPAVGLVLEKKIGDEVKAGENLCTVHYNLDARLVPAMRLLSASFEIGDEAPPATAARAQNHRRGKNRMTLYAFKGGIRACTAW